MDLAKIIQMKLGVMDCLEENLKKDIKRLKEAKESNIKRDLAYRGISLYEKSVELTSYVKALDDVLKVLECNIEDYASVLIESYEEDSRELRMAEDIEDNCVLDIEDQYNVDIECEYNKDTDTVPF